MHLDDALERWARWCHQGQIVPTQTSSQTALLMEILATGITGPGNNGGGKVPILDGIEPRGQLFQVEQRLMQPAAQQPAAHGSARAIEHAK